MRIPHAARPVLVVDNSRNITLGLCDARKKIKRNAFNFPDTGTHYEGGPEAGRDAVPRPHGADMAIARSGVLAKRPGRGPSVDHFLKRLHGSRTLHNVAWHVNTKCSGLAVTICSIMETRADRLKDARKRTGHESAQSFADAHGIPGSTQRTREAGTRGISVKIAEEYQGYFRHLWPFLVQFEKLLKTAS